MWALECVSRSCQPPSAMNIVLDELQRLFLLSSLPNSWETLMASTSNPTSSKITLDMVKESVSNEENRRKETSIDHGQALITEDWGRGKNKGPRDDNKSRNRSKSREMPKCYDYWKPWHLKRNCKILKQEQKGQKKNQKEVHDQNTAAIATRSADDSVTLVCASGG